MVGEGESFMEEEGKGEEEKEQGRLGEDIVYLEVLDRHPMR